MPEAEIFSVSAQAEFVKNLGKHVASEAKQFGMHGDQEALNPLNSIDTIAVSLREAGVDQDYIRAVESIKHDADIQEALRIFQDSLDGKDNIHRIADMVPQTSSDGGGGLFPTFSGTVSEDGETDVIRFSNYLSGAGTTVGGFLADLPQNMSDMANGITNASFFRYAKLQGKLEVLSGDLSKVVEENENYIRSYGYNPEDGRRKRKGYTVDLSSSVADSSKKTVRVDYESRQEGLLRKTFLTNASLQYQTSRHKGRLRAQKLFGKIGKGVQGATSGFGVALGGVDIAAGDEMIQNAQRRYQSGEISKSQYDKDMRDARFRISQGAFGIGDGLNSVRQLVMDKVGDQAKNLAKGARMGLRFASVVGGAFSIGMGVTSIAKNAIAAHDAQESGNAGRAAIYGIMAGLDCVSVALDAVSMVLDFIPGIGTALSFVVDLANTIVGLVNMVIGFFADMVDTRTPEERLKASFDTHIESPAFQKYLNNQAQMYTEEGYDLFTLMVDAAALGLEEEGAEATEVKDTIVRKLSEKALQDGKDPQLRVALVDISTLGEVLEGRLNDDKILAGAGKDTLYGYAGDDILFGEAGEDTIYGGPGNDYLNGGTSRDKLIGGTGDDLLSYEPGIDTLARGGEDTDTLEISAGFFASSTADNQKALVFERDTRHRVYVNLTNQSSEKGHGGVNLGALLNNIDLLSNRMHKPAFSSNSAEAIRLVNVLYATSGKAVVSKQDLEGTYFWYLANKEGRDYLTDGRFLYSCEEDVSNENRVIHRAVYDISGISRDEAVLYTKDDNKHAYMAYKTKPLESMFAFAFNTQSDICGIERVCENLYDVRAPEPIDVNCNVIGDSKTRLIDVACGDNEYVYTGDGDTVVLFTLSNSPQWEICKFIVGGSGSNTLVINGGSRNTSRPNFNSASYQCILLDHDIDLGNANRFPNDANNHSWPRNNEKKVDRGVFIKNMETIQFSNFPSDMNTFHADCTNLSSGHRFILDDHRGYLRFVGSSGDDNLMVKRLTGTDNIIDGHLRRNMLSLEVFEPSISLAIDIDVPPNHFSGSLTGSNFSVAVRNIQSVQGHALTRIIDGHSVEDNLLIANGGKCKVNGRGGNNTIISMRGHHTLNSGSGQGAYELYGPSIEDFVVITISNRKEEGITAQSAKGTWSGSQLTIDLLPNDPTGIIISQVSLIDRNGQVVEGKGRIWTDRNKRKIYYEPGSAFRSMERGKSESLRVKYVTEGNTAVIHESTTGNRLKLHSLSNKSELRVRVSTDGDLQFSDNINRLVFTDKHFGDLFKAGVTNLNSLVIDFTARFPIIQFSGTDTDNAEISKTKVFDFLITKLRELKVSSNEFGNLYDTGTVTGNLFDVHGGDNFVYGKRRKVTYKSGNGDDIFDLTQLGTASDGSMPYTTVKTGAGDDLVAIGSSTHDVHIHFIEDGATTKQGTKTLVFRDVRPNDLAVVQSGSQWTFSHGTTPLVLADCAPDLIMCSSNSEHILIDDVSEYLSQREMGGDYYYRRVYNDKLEQKLLLTDFNREDITLDISVDVSGLVFRMKADNEVIYTFQLGVATTTTFDARNIVQAFQLEFKKGIFFETCTLEAPQMRTLVMDILRSSDRHRITGSREFDHVVHASTVSSPHTIPTGDALVYADEEGSTIYANEGNNVIKISASNLVVNTGRTQNTIDGHDIVQMSANLRDVTVQFKGQGDSYSVGRKYMIMEGLSCDSISLGDANGNPLQHYSSESEPFVIKSGSMVVAKFDSAPFHFLFRSGDQYEVVESASYFLRMKGEGSWKQRYVLNKDMKAVFLAEDFDSTDLFLSVSRGYSYVRVVFKTSQIYNVDQFRVGKIGYSTIAKAELASLIAVRMSGGLRFRDRAIPSSGVVTFLQEVLAKPETLTNRIVLSSGSATSSVEDLLADEDPFEKFVDAIKKCIQTVSIENIWD
ncbi:unnamed protein product [Agarophyton chilense]